MLTDWNQEQIVSAFTRTEERRFSAADKSLDVEFERLRPFYLLRPRMFPDGNQWCALYGENLQMGVCGFGDTPEKAACAFDLAWLNAAPPPTKQSETIGDLRSDNEYKTEQVRVLQEHLREEDKPVRIHIQEVLNG